MSEKIKIKKKRKIIVSLACRVDGSRLFGKPLQNLDINKNRNILDIIIGQLLTCFKKKNIILAISKKKNNRCFIEYAKKNNINFILGDEEDVLNRLILSCKKLNGTDIFRITTESPFIYMNNLKKIIKSHIENNFDLTALDNVPDGTGYEIIKLKALIYSWKNGKNRHRSELCSLYIRENKEKFKIQKIKVPNYLARTDLRLTVDYPEDLILCRIVFSNFKKDYPKFKLKNIIKFLDKNHRLKKLVNMHVDEGMKTMYL